MVLCEFSLLYLHILISCIYCKECWLFNMIHYSILVDSVYSCGWWNSTVFWLCCCKHEWLKTSGTSCYCISPLAADNSFSLYISPGVFWPWVSCQFLFVFLSKVLLMWFSLGLSESLCFCIFKRFYFSF